MAWSIHSFSDLDEADLSAVPPAVQTGSELREWISENGKSLHYTVHADCRDRVERETNVPKPIIVPHRSLSCDGSSSEDIGGWAFLIRTGEMVVEMGMGAEKNCDSQRAELLAVEHGLTKISPPDIVHVYSDNLFVVDVLSALVEGERKSIQMLLGRHPRFSGLIEKIRRSAEEITIFCSHVRRNSTYDMILCDSLSREAQTRLRERMRDGDK